MTTTATRITEDDLKHLAVCITASTTHKLGAVRLDEFPLLVYSPMQESHNHPDFSKPHDPLVHGNVIRTEDHGIPVSAIAAKAAEVQDYEQLAKTFSTTHEHIRQAIAYAVQTVAKPGV